MVPLIASWYQAGINDSSLFGAGGDTTRIDRGSILRTDVQKKEENANERGQQMAQFFQVGHYLINPENVAYIETEHGPTGKDILVYFTGPEKTPIHISGQYSDGLLKRLNITSIPMESHDSSQPNYKLWDHLRRVEEQEHLKKLEDSDL